MNDALSPNAQAILLLTAPLIIGRASRSPVKPLKESEYNRLADRLRDLGRQPADLLGDGERALLEECRDVDPEHPERLRRLLGRGFLLSQALERWHARALWVVSRAEPEYPQRLKERLGKRAPPVLYGCGGNRAALDSGGLAVVGSRNVQDDLIAYTEEVGRLTAEAGRTLVSGGARGVDQAAMRGALDAGGTGVCVLANGLERAATQRKQRDLLMAGRLVLICPYDPAAGFHRWHAMERNKLIHALADAALVVEAEFEKGGTWTGASERLKMNGKLESEQREIDRKRDEERLVPVYVRAKGDVGKGLNGLCALGAHEWPEPDSAEALRSLLDTPPEPASSPDSAFLPLEAPEDREEVDGIQPAAAGKAGGAAGEGPLHRAPESREAAAATGKAGVKSGFRDGRSGGDRTGPPEPDGRTESTAAPHELRTDAATLLEEVRALLLRYLSEPRTEGEIKAALEVQKNQASDWLKRLADDGAIEKLRQPVRYRAARAARALDSAGSGNPAGSGSDVGFEPAEAAEKLFARVSELLLPYLDGPRTVPDVAEWLGVQPDQAQKWLKRLVDEGAIDRFRQPVCWRAARAGRAVHPAGSGSSLGLDLAEALFARVSELLLPYLDEPHQYRNSDVVRRQPGTVADVASRLDVQPGQAQTWLKRLTDEGRIEKLLGPVRYRTARAAPRSGRDCSAQSDLFQPSGPMNADRDM